ncbi:DUF4376 domain-containing protein [Leptospira bouyouniensis]|uniref:DUF4376 domain-containing protein n=1 Tax=Leptospira bouyouniensis TaxID=2484911 RepID=UPI00109129EE|nr:DUF4376 domain-containing protein [Leptospira bouyouniensis]TGM88287.1 DUF4376 domain-containing protein [Leptospira bouyouniensis]
MNSNVFYIIKKNQILWGPHDHPEAFNDAQLLCQESLGEEIVSEYPPKGRVWDPTSEDWRSKTISEKVLDGEIELSTRIVELKFEIFKFAYTKCELGVSFFGHIFQAREEDCTRMNNALKKVELGGQWRGSWRDRENNWIEISVPQLQQLALIVGEYYEDTFRTARVLIDELQNLSINEIATYDLENRWIEASSNEVP